MHDENESGEYESPKYFCGGCGLIFDMDDVVQDQWDNLNCPDCGERDIGSLDDV